MCAIRRLPITGHANNVNVINNLIDYSRLN